MNDRVNEMPGKHEAKSVVLIGRTTGKGKVRAFESDTSARVCQLVCRVINEKCNGWWWWWRRRAVMIKYLAI